MMPLRIAFVGQCHTVGYPGVPPDAAFPQVCRSVIQARRPEARVEVVPQEYQHPTDLPDAIAAALRRKPCVVVIEVVGFLTIRGRNSVDLGRLPKGVRSVYQRVRHFRHVSQTLVAKIPKASGLVYSVQRGAFHALGAVLPGIAPRTTRPTLSEYEEYVGRAIDDVKQHAGVHCVVQGPGAPNLTLDSRHLAADAIERYRGVEQMARRVAENHGALYVDRWDTVASGFFLPGSIRPSAEGHSVWGHLLADQLLRAGVV